MDKFEYKVRADEIKELIAQGEYLQAADIADTIDWRRVKSVMMLCTISDLYKVNRRYEDAKNILLLAYERRPGGRTICYSLCELCIKTEEFVQAVIYYKEFVQVAPKDPGRYILQYKLYEAQDVGLEERISVLEELKKRDYRERWAYELAYLYHRVGLATRCVEECDELILWFGEGKYVIKAMELKMLHSPLTPEQQQRYEHRFHNKMLDAQSEDRPEEAWEGSEPTQAETGFYAEDNSQTDEYGEGNDADLLYQEEQQDQIVPDAAQPQGYEAADRPAAAHMEEVDIHVKPMDVGQYNTINLQAELAEGLKEVLGERHNRENEITRAILEPMLNSDTESLDFPNIEEVSEEDLGPEAEEVESSEVFFGETTDFSALHSEPEMEELSTPQIQDMKELGVLPESLSGADETAYTVLNQMRKESMDKVSEGVMTVQPPEPLARVLAQESDGQISIVVPESEKIEKQITGQMSIEDILAEWERMKRENEEKRKEEVRQHVLQQTGTMFTEFEAAVRDGLLEQLEQGSGIGAEASDDTEEAAAEVAGAEASDTGESGIEDIAAEVELGAAVTGAVSDLEAASEAVSAGILAEQITEDDEYADEQITEAFEEEPEEALEAEPEEEFETEELEEIEEAEDAPEEPEEILETIGDDEYAAEQTAEGFEQEPEEEPEETLETIGDDEYAAEQPAEGFEQTAEGFEQEPEETLETAGDDEYAAEQPAEGFEQEPEEEPEETLETAGDNEYAAEQPAEEGEYEAEMEFEGIEEETPVERDRTKARSLTKEEKELYGPFIQSRAAREALVRAIDNISMAAYTGNVIVTGDEGMDTITLAKNMIREIQMTDSNFSGKVAKITGEGLNNKNLEDTLEKLKNGALIVQRASSINSETASALHKILQKESLGIIVVLEDTKKAMNRFLGDHEALTECFTARVDVEALSNDTLVAFGRQYARELEYSIDELGILALHTRIEELQTIDHAVTVLEVKEMVEEAVRHANKKTLGHFFDILFAKRYDEEDMIILTEKDFS